MLLIQRPRSVTYTARKRKMPTHGVQNLTTQPMNEGLSAPALLFWKGPWSPQQPPPQLLQQPLQHTFLLPRAIDERSGGEGKQRAVVRMSSTVAVAGKTTSENQRTTVVRSSFASTPAAATADGGVFPPSRWEQLSSERALLEKVSELTLVDDGYDDNECLARSTRSGCSSSSSSRGSHQESTATTPQDRRSRGAATAFLSPPLPSRDGGGRAFTGHSKRRGKSTKRKGTGNQYICPTTPPVRRGSSSFSSSSRSGGGAAAAAASSATATKRSRRGSFTELLGNAPRLPSMSELTRAGGANNDDDDNDCVARNARPMCYRPAPCFSPGIFTVARAPRRFSFAESTSATTTTTTTRLFRHPPPQTTSSSSSSPPPMPLITDVLGQRKALALQMRRRADCAFSPLLYMP